jgi:glycosyltransferase involved in cell wall biosynthesis
MSTYVLVAGDFVTTGGQDRANHALAKYLADEGHEVHLVAHRVAEDLLLRRHVHFHRVPKPLGSYLLGGPLLDRLGRYWGRKLARQGARVLVNGGNCRFGDANWVHYVHAAYTPQQAAGGWRRAVAKLKHRMFLRDERRSLSAARIIFANSERTRRDLIERVGIDPNRIRVVYYGADGRQFHPADEAERARIRAKLDWPADRPVVAFVGALGDRRKGFDTVLAAWKRLHAGGFDALLAVIGSGAELPVFRREAAEAGLGGSIDFLGFRRDVPELLRGCDALVAPTRYEAFGLGVHEAMCCGLPAIVSRDAGVAELYPQHLDDLLIRDPDSVDELTQRLRAWRERVSDYRSALLALSTQLLSRSWEKMAAEIQTHLEMVDTPAESVVAAGAAATEIVSASAVIDS